MTSTVRQAARSLRRVGRRRERLGSALARIIEANGLFDPDLLGGMIAGYLSGESPCDLGLTADDGGPVAIAYRVPERMTRGTWNLLLIAVRPDRQSQGRGAALVRHVESVIAARGARVLLVETSGLPTFARARAFYPRCGSAKEARIGDFYDAGEDKVVLRKTLLPADENTRLP